MDVSDAKRLKALEQENARLKKLLAETMLDKEALEVALRKSIDPTGQMPGCGRNAGRKRHFGAPSLSACGAVSQYLAL